MKKLLVLVRISKPSYNETLYDKYVLYMNPQKKYRDSRLSEGQYDKHEGAIAIAPLKINCLDDGKVISYELGSDGIVYKENKAYIFCMYAITFDQNTYDEDSNKFYHRIPWEYIKPLWQEEGTELMVLINTSVFINKFLEAAKRQGYKCAYSLVKYDLNEKLRDSNYFELALKDDFEAIFHKTKDRYELQKEFRMAVICQEEQEHVELELLNDQQMKFYTIPLEYGKDVIVEIENLEFEENKLPRRFSDKLNFYEPDKSRE